MTHYILHCLWKIVLTHLNQWSACFFMCSSKLSTIQLIFCRQNVSNFTHKNTCCSSVNIQLSHTGSMMFLCLLLCMYPCWPIWAEQHVFGCSVFFQSELHKPTSLLLPAITLKCRLEQALVMCACLHTLSTDGRACCTVVRLRLANRASFNLTCSFFLYVFADEGIRGCVCSAQQRFTVDLG